MEDTRPPREDLVRASREIALTRNTEDGMPTLTGHFAVFDQWTEIRSAFEGHFMERFSPGAFDKTIRENGDNIKVLFEHGKDPQIGNKVLGKVRSLAPDATGVLYDVGLFDTTYVRDLVPGLEAGEYGASFRFRVLKEEFDSKPRRSKANPDGIPERTVTEAAVAEFGPVTFPAYPGATAGIRSLTDRFLFEALVEDPDRLRELIDGRKKSRAFIASAPTARITYTTKDQSSTMELVDLDSTRLQQNNSEEPEGEHRMDSEDLSVLGQMLELGACYIEEQDEPEDQANIPKMQAILEGIAALVPVEVAENEPEDEPEDESASADARMKPEPSGATTSPEPEPSGATTRARTVTTKSGLIIKPRKDKKWHL